MHPASSVIFFTVFSGAGFGLLVLMGLATTSKATPTTAFLVVHFGLAFAMAVGGLISSTYHLGHPERAWRALSQWRSSWLSREGVFAILTLMVAGLYAFLWVFYDRPIGVLGWISSILGLLTVYATGMIYAQIKAVQVWSRWLTPVCYLLFSLAGGALLFISLHAVFFGTAGSFLSSVAMIFMLVAWVAKLFWWFWAGRIVPLSTPGSATGLGSIGETRLFESPHTGSNYLMKEMGHQIARKHATKLRWIALIFGGVLPIALILLALPAPFDAFWLILAVISHLIGMLVERWLFFAEAKHAVMNFYQ